jgi:exodeoxyribonuclease V gamma subunit
MYRAVLGAEVVPMQMPFDKAALLWRLVRLLPPLCAANAVYAPLQRYLAGDNATLALPDEHAWQAQLCRDLRLDVGPELAEA